MPLIRGHHAFDDHFTQIPNDWVRDAALSFKARGLLALLMSHRPGWNMSIRSIARANGVGFDTVKTAVEELETAGYLKREPTQKRSEDGTFADFVWTTQDPYRNPDTEKSRRGETGHKEDYLPIEEQDYKKLPRSKFEDVFEDFWKLYPRKVEKIDARKAFEKAFVEYGQEVMDGVARLAADRNLPPLQFIPYPASWLRAGGWTNEPYPEREKTKEERERDYLAKAERDRERERLQSERLRREAEEARQAATPAPKCEHDLALWKCDECTRRLADAAADE